MGPMPPSPPIDARSLRAALAAGRRGPIKPALLDHGESRGSADIYCGRGVWEARVDPRAAPPARSAPCAPARWWRACAPCSPAPWRTRAATRTTRRSTGCRCTAGWGAVPALRHAGPAHRAGGTLHLLLRGLPAEVARRPAQSIASSSAPLM
jgi:hypothetical protein